MNQTLGNIKVSIIMRFGLRYIKESAYFDADWYTATYGLADNTDSARHYLDEGWKLGFDPSIRFSTAGYLQHYQDVFKSGMNPLLHYEKYGKYEDRKTLFPIEQEDDSEQGGFDYVYRKDPPEMMKSCAVFAACSFDQTIPEYIVYYLKELSKVVDGIVFISDNRIRSFDEIEKIKQFVFYAAFSRHGSSFFGSWKRGLRHLADSEKLSFLDELVLANDDCYGPVNGFSEVFTQMRQKKCDYWGLLDPLMPDCRAQSSFYVFNKDVIENKTLRIFFDRIPEKLFSEEAEAFFEKELNAVLRSKYTSEYYIHPIQSEAVAALSGDFTQAVELFSLLKSGFPLVFLKGNSGRPDMDYHRALLFVREQNETLYSLITGDLYRRINEKNGSGKARVDDFTRIVENKKTVSFDVFDTLLTRPFAKPTDVFGYIETVCNLPGFAQARIEAERSARKNKRIDSGSEEVTVDEIYAVIVPKFKGVKKIELHTENALIRANPLLKPLYDQAKTSGKRIIAASDMYLPKEFIERLLIGNGYEEIEEVFVSSVNNHNKGSGELYAEALDSIKCSKTDIVHFGDNFESDVVSAKRFGIDAFQTPRIDECLTDSSANRKYYEFLKRHDDEIAVSIYSALISKYFSSLDPKTPFYTMLGYSLGGCLALAYLNYVCEEAERNGIDHLMFVARDGYSLLEIYKEFFSEKYNIPSSYVYLNRNVVLGVLDGIPEEPRYLYSTLKLAKKAISSIVVSDDDELNIREYKKHEKEIEEWKEKNRSILNTHLNSAVGNADKICVVDMTTGQFSSLHGARAILGERISMGLFTGVFPVSVALAPYESFCKRKLKTCDEIAIKFSELLLTSPEESIGGLDEKGKPVYDQKVESNREKRYHEIMAGIKEYCREYLNSMPLNQKLLISFEQWIDLINCYCKYCNEADKYYLDDVVESPDPDVTHVRNSLVKIIEEKQEKD